MEDFGSYIKDRKTVLIIASRPLDFDCLSSGLILKKYLESLGKDVRLMHPFKFNKEDKEYYDFLPYFEEIEDKDTYKFLQKKNFDLLIFVDGANIEQFYDEENSEGVLPDLSVYDKRIHIDHHLNNFGNLGTLTIHRPSVCSTTEIITTEIIPDEFLDENIATLAYCGIGGDTGNFKYSFSPATLALASKLLEKGADWMAFVDRFFYWKSKTYLEMLDLAIENTVYDDKLATSFILFPYQKLEEHKINSYGLSELKRAVDEELARCVPGYPRTMLIYEKAPGKISVSGRGSTLHNQVSLPQLFSELSGNSGGHFNASGLSARGDFNQFVVELKAKLKERLTDIKGF